MGPIRLFLALVVVSDHFQNWVLAPAGLHLTGPFKLGLSGPAAVMYFYVISGFLISLVLKTEYEAAPAGTRKFYTSRLIRIFSLYWPLYLFVMTFDIWQARQSITGPLDVLTGMFLFGADWSIAFSSYPDLHFQAVPFALVVAWTLGAELTFYALAPFLLRLTALSLALLALSFILRLVIYLLIGFSASWSYMFFPAVLGFFLLGHAARLAYEHFAISPPVSWAILAASVAISLPNRVNMFWETRYFYASIVLFALAIPGIVAGLSRNGWLSRIGDFSYPVYLIHPLVLYALFVRPGASSLPMVTFATEVSARTGLDVAPVMAAIATSIVIATAAVIFYLVERPVANFLWRTASNLKAFSSPSSAGR